MYCSISSHASRWCPCQAPPAGWLPNLEEVIPRELYLKSFGPSIGAFKIAGYMFTRLPFTLPIPLQCTKGLRSSFDYVSCILVVKIIQSNGMFIPWEWCEPPIPSLAQAQHYILYCYPNGPLTSPTTHQLSYELPSTSGKSQFLTGLAYLRHLKLSLKGTYCRVHWWKLFIPT